MFLKDLKLGFGSYGKAWNFIFRNGLWYFFLFPLIIWCILFWLSWELADSIADVIVNYICGWIGCPEAQPAENLPWYSWLWAKIGGGLSWGLRLTIKLSLSVFGAWLAKYLTLILLSPILAWLSEKVENVLTGNDYAFSWKQLVKDTQRGILLALRNMCVEFFFIFLAWIMALALPGLGKLLAIPVWVLGWYFIGFSMMDYVNERRRLSVRESVRYVRKHKGLAIGNGWMYSIITGFGSFLEMLPLAVLAGPVSLMFAPVLACVAATLAIHQLEGLENNPHAINPNRFRQQGPGTNPQDQAGNKPYPKPPAAPKGTTPPPFNSL